MRTWEVMQRKGKFKRKSDGLELKISEDGTLQWPSGYEFLNINDDWEEIKKPLTFMEMLEKVEENPYCKVSVEHKEILRKHITGESLKDLLDKLERRFTNAVMAIMLLEGKFYIEED